MLVGGLFVMEALSVIVQVASFKLTGKRVLRMAPIHHHFELVRLVRAQDHRSVLDLGVPLFTDRTGDVEAEMTTAQTNSNPGGESWSTDSELPGTAATRFLQRPGRRSRGRGPALGAVIFATGSSRGVRASSSAESDGAATETGGRVSSWETSPAVLPEGVDAVVVSPGIVSRTCRFCNRLVKTGRCHPGRGRAGVSSSAWPGHWDHRQQRQEHDHRDDRSAASRPLGSPRKICGNIGVPLVSVVDGTPRPRVRGRALELSARNSWLSFAPGPRRCSIFPPITWIDTAAWRSISRPRPESSRARKRMTSPCLNADDPLVRAIGTRARKRYFSRRQTRSVDGCYLEG